MTLIREAPALLVFLLATALLAGCLGGDDGPDAGDSGDGTEQDGDTGSIVGRVLTTELREIQGAQISLVADGESVEQAQTDENGDYEIRGIEPGDYLLQVSAACCREDVGAVQVEAGESTRQDVQLSPFTEADLRTPFVDEFEWNGFISCAVGSPVVVISVCSLEELDDPNDDFMHFFNISEGIESIVLGMEWDPAGGLIGEELQMILENEGCDAFECDQTYGSADGTSPIYIHANSPSGDFAFENIEDKRPLQIRVFPAFEPEVYYQQPFTIHIHQFYYDEAPEDYDPIPDS